MLISAIDCVDLPIEYPELAGRRVLVTGVGGELSFEVVRLIADQRAALVIVATGDTPEVQALAEIVAPTAPELRLFTGPFADYEARVRVARDALQCHGGIDAVINLAELGGLPEQAGDDEIERLVVELLAMPCLVTKVAANRMRTTMTEGSIVNILTGPRLSSERERLVARIAQSALASFTRREAEAMSCDGIRLNAVAPSERVSGAGCLTGSPDIASLALHLASGRGHRLSGLVFEAAA